MLSESLTHHGSSYPHKTTRCDTLIISNPGMVLGNLTRANECIIMHVYSRADNGLHDHDFSLLSVADTSTVNHYPLTT